MRCSTLVFGESERGPFRSLMHVKHIQQLAHALGNPPENTQGIAFAVQTLLNDQDLYFVRVEEEGFSKSDYFQGLSAACHASIEGLAAISLPGVGDAEIISACTDICKTSGSVLILSEQDLYDYLTN